MQQTSLRNNSTFKALSASIRRINTENEKLNRLKTDLKPSEKKIKSYHQFGVSHSGVQQLYEEVVNTDRMRELVGSDMPIIQKGLQRMSDLYEEKKLDVASDIEFVTGEKTSGHSDTGIMGMTPPIRHSQKNPASRAPSAQIKETMSRHKVLARQGVILEVAKKMGKSPYVIPFSYFPMYNESGFPYYYPYRSSTENEFTMDFKRATHRALLDLAPTRILTIWGEYSSGIVQYAKSETVKEIIVLYPKDYDGSKLFDDTYSKLVDQDVVIDLSYKVSDKCLNQLVKLSKAGLEQETGIPDLKEFTLIYTYLPSAAMVASYFKSSYAIVASETIISDASEASLPPYSGTKELDGAILADFVMAYNKEVLTNEKLQFLYDPLTSDAVVYCQHQVWRDKIWTKNQLMSVLPAHTQLQSMRDYLGPEGSKDSSYYNVVLTRETKKRNEEYDLDALIIDDKGEIDVSNLFMPGEVYYLPRVKTKIIALQSSIWIHPRGYPLTLPFIGDYLITYYQDREVFLDYGQEGIPYMERRRRMEKSGMPLLPMSSVPYWNNFVCWPSMQLLVSTFSYKPEDDVQTGLLMDMDYDFCFQDDPYDNPLVLEPLYTIMKGLCYDKEEMTFYLDKSYTAYYYHTRVNSAVVGLVTKMRKRNYRMYRQRTSYYTSPLIPGLHIPEANTGVRLSINVVEYMLLQLGCYPAEVEVFLDFYRDLGADYDEFLGKDCDFSSSQEEDENLIF
jgi:hypothetical protein